MSGTTTRPLARGLSLVTMSNCVINSNSSTRVKSVAVGDAPTPTWLVCNRGGTACGSVLSFPTVAGQHYLVRAATFAAEFFREKSQPRRGTATLTFTEQAALTNETCGAADRTERPGDDQLERHARGCRRPTARVHHRGDEKDLWYDTAR